MSESEIILNGLKHLDANASRLFVLWAVLYYAVLPSVIGAAVVLSVRALVDLCRKAGENDSHEQIVADLKSKLNQAEGDSVVATSEMRRMEETQCEFVSSRIDPATEHPWRRCSLDLPKYVASLESELDELKLKAGKQQ